MSGLLSQSESLTLELKSDRMRLSNSMLIEAWVGLVNTDGELWLGVADDGQVTGLNVDHIDRFGGYGGGGPHLRHGQWLPQGKLPRPENRRSARVRRISDTAVVVGAVG